MISKAQVKFVRISPRKVRYVIDLIRNKKVDQAQAILTGTPRRAGEILRKLLDQAIDAAVKNSQVQPADLKISKVTADGGPMMKRFRAMSMGRAGRIQKRTSHIYLELDWNKKAMAAIQPVVTKKAQSAKPTAEISAAKAPKKKTAKKEVGAR